MLAYERHGRGEPLVLVHGLSHRRQAWYPILDELAEQREVILVDLPGHGESPPFVADGRSVPAVLRTEFQRFLADAGLDRPHVAGNSLGGLVALYAGARGDARSVTALSPAGFWRSRAQFSYTRQILVRAGVLSAQLHNRIGMLPRTRAGRNLMYGLVCAHPARVSRDQAIGDLRGYLYARPTLRAMLAAADPFDEEIPPDVPITIAWAARDLVLPPWQAEQAKRQLPFAEHLMMPGVGHVPMTDDPAGVARILLHGSMPVAAVAPLRARAAGERLSPAATA